MTRTSSGVSRLLNGRRDGLTVIELLVVLAFISVAVGIVVPRFRISPGMQVRGAAQVLAQDLELVRTRALATRSFAMVRFDDVNHRYDAFLDVDADSAFTESQQEIDSLRVFRGRALEPGVRFSLGSASALTGVGSPSPVDVSGNRMVISSRGITSPFGAEGVLYLAHADDASKVAAVRITPSGAIEVWTWRGDRWE
jgi:Tfp pilus assembly protein FimT